MAFSKNLTENKVYEFVLAGELKIDSQGRVWRLACRASDRWRGGTRVLRCHPRRAEHVAHEYMQVRVMDDGVRYCCSAHRLVWRHFFGPIPEQLTINHKNGIKQDNRPSNLELATHSEQAVHALRVLKHGRVDQYGVRNAMSKLTAAQVIEIRRRRNLHKEPLKVIASDYGVSDRTISKIALGQRWSHPILDWKLEDFPEHLRVREFPES